MIFDFPLQWDSSQFYFNLILSVGIDNDNGDIDESESNHGNNEEGNSGKVFYSQNV